MGAGLGEKQKGEAFESGSGNYWNSEVGPVVVPNERDYAAAKDAAFDKLRRGKVGNKRFKKRISNPAANR
jgi:hypothetical protein